MKKIILALTAAIILSVTTACAACNKEIGACSISDLKKISQANNGSVHVPPPPQDRTKDSAAMNKLSVRKFIVSLLKPSE